MLMSIITVCQRVCSVYIEMSCDTSPFRACHVVAHVMPHVSFLF